MPFPDTRPVELLYRPAAPLRMRPHTRGNYRQTCNIVYAEAHGVGLVMDRFEPEEKNNGLGVIDVVSGGWHSDRMLLNEHIGFGIVDALCHRGFTVFAVSPGSLPLFTGLEMVRHVHAAVRHIKTHAGHYGIDAERLGVLGVSAGGHLAALTALKPSRGRPESRDPLRRWGTEVAAAALFFPPTDLLDYQGVRFDKYRIEGLDLARLLFHHGRDGVSEAEMEKRLIELSPARMASPNLLPLMIVQGKADLVVPWEQAEKLAKTMSDAGGAPRLLYKEAGGHVWPDIVVEVEETARWLEAMLTPA